MTYLVKVTIFAISLHSTASTTNPNFSLQLEVEVLALSRIITILQVIPNTELLMEATVMAVLEAL